MRSECGKIDSATVEIVALEDEPTVKHPVRQFKDLAVALKEMEPFIRDGRHLLTGKPFKNFGGMRSREILANWLVCAAINAADQKAMTFSTDPIGGDGIVFDPASGNTFPTEHVIVPPAQGSKTHEGEALILKAIEQKCAKGGKPYASGKTLIVFMEAGTGAWKPNRAARQLPKPLHFAGVWVVGLNGPPSGSYVYGVTHLDLTDGDAPAFLVSINPDFRSWTVTRVQ